MYDAIFRHSLILETSQIDVFRPSECLTFAEALWIYTVGSAYACGSEGILGEIENGFAADFVIVDRDIVDNPVMLKSVAPHLVCVGGIIRYRSLDFVGVITSIDMEAISEKTDREIDISMGGPYVPGKNGSISRNFSSKPDDGCLGIDFTKAFGRNKGKCNCSLKMGAK